jgi:NADH-ubiquinone oxidoreductase chain 5
LGFGYNISFKLIDRGLLEYVGPIGLINFIGKLSKKISFFQSGFIYHYALTMIIGLTSFIFLFFIPDFFYNGLTVIISFFGIYLLIGKRYKKEVNEK